ncbi:hypothetical protein PICMEDRAFT_13961 [Pichia membranifaciens NRRL Y-2026]|uniref:Elongation of fatty acids protein n=1 Tax=Pichia membranifaciens NRRL Y-2026 TaxID=763406 RepID=A0A1E3NQK0_9ASCO|nr:hypothetical protein PICMEDRAFT_13961 [Pichia membranifaciens NRRL Y-2026]ODQ48380.1 hypothetical protein PICMEDRAFT_13961 [Pichia membranifaciens NRRL Y-2026]
MSGINTTESSLLDALIQWKFFPDVNTFGIPDFSKPVPAWPFDFSNALLRTVVYPVSLNGYIALIFATTYFLSVHHFNKVVQNRQIEQFQKTNPGEKLPKNLKQLKAAPFKIATWRIFKVLVFLHNVFLCVYSVWTFIGMTRTINQISHKVFAVLFQDVKSSPLSRTELFWHCVCNNNNTTDNIWSNSQDLNVKGLTFYAYLFYLSKYYEILDTAIILLKGRPSSLLQSYHHSGAILCMWSGVRYMSSPIWIFVVFNSFIHSLMYFYFSLSCIKIRLPKWFKQSLTSLQILQFVIGGSLAVVHLFVRYYDSVNGSFSSCIATSEQALAVYINVFYLAPLTLLFAAFYIDSYKKKKAIVSKKKI